MARLSGILFGLVMAVALALTAALLLRDILAIAWHVPLDPNEGWNAYHALTAIHGYSLYPHAPHMMVNNYPPLSFYLTGAVSKLTGDAIIAGRLVSLAAFFVIVTGLAMLLRQWNASIPTSLFAGLVFAATLLIASDYVAMNDPQLLGHALQILGLLLVARQRPMIVGGALLMAAGLFVKHNLVTMPLATALWLISHDRKSAIWFVFTGLAAGLAGLGIIGLFGIDLLHEIFTARILSFANFRRGMVHFLALFLLPLIATLWLFWRHPHDKWTRFAIFYVVIASALALFFAAGDGVDANAFFDAAIALSLSGGLAIGRFPPCGRLTVALAYLAPLGLLLARNFQADNFDYGAAFRREAAADTAFLTEHRGPALCEELALCYWAAKDASVDVFNMSEAFASGARSDAALVTDIVRCRFSAIQLDDLDDLGSNVRMALLAHYHIDHQDDDGLFLVRRGCGRQGLP